MYLSNLHMFSVKTALFSEVYNYITNIHSFSFNFTF